MRVLQGRLFSQQAQNICITFVQTSSTLVQHCIKVIQLFVFTGLALSDAVLCFDHQGGGGDLGVVFSTAASFHTRVRGSFPCLAGLKETKLFLPHPLVKLSIVGSLHDREVAFLASDLQGFNFESCVWRAVSSHPQEAQALKPDSFHFICFDHQDAYFTNSSAQCVVGFLHCQCQANFFCDQGFHWKRTHYFVLKGLAQAKIIKKSVILFRLLNMTI